MNITDQIQTELALFVTKTNKAPKKIFLGQKQYAKLEKVLYDNDFKLDNRPFPYRTEVFGCVVYKVDDKSYLGILD